MPSQGKPKRTRTARVTLDLTVEEREQLKEAAWRTRQSMQALIRSLLNREVFSQQES